MRTALVYSILIAAAATAPVAAAEKVQLSVDVSKAGAKIDRNIFGQFAEHLGHGIYEGIWVGPKSTIPNTRGIRNDVVAALKRLNPTTLPAGNATAERFDANADGLQFAATLLGVRGPRRGVLMLVGLNRGGHLLQS